MTTWHTVAAVAENFDVSRQFVYDRIHDGSWPHRKLGDRTYRFSDEHLAQIEEAAVTPQKISAHRKRRAVEASRKIA